MRKPPYDMLSIKYSMLMPPPKAYTKSYTNNNTSYDDTKSFYSQYTNSNTYHHSTCPLIAEPPQQPKILSKKFYKLRKPQSESEIKKFIKNMEEYIDYMLDALNISNKDNPNVEILKIKLSTRTEDYIQGGMNKNYFVNSLLQMQRELEAFVFMYNDSIVENDYWGCKYDD